MASVQFGNFRHLAWPMATRSASAILLIFLLACSPSKKGGSLHLVCEEKLRPGIEAVAKVFQVRYSAKVKIAWVDKIEGSEFESDSTHLYFKLDSMDFNTELQQERIGFLEDRSVVMLVRGDYQELDGAFGAYLVSPAGQKILEKESWKPRFEYKRMLQFETPGSN
jgi:hypothetical protein